MNSNVMISGPITLRVFNFNERLFFFFGDQHHSLSGNCEEKYNIKCDEFDYKFEKSIIYDGNCWTIGSLLDEWLTYNNYFAISTDFYLEVPFAKGDISFDPLPLTEIKRRRQSENNQGSYKVEGLSDWISLIYAFFSECFKQTKQECKYSPNIKFHYTDVRFRNINGDVERNNIYNIRPYFTIIAQNLRENKEKVILDFNSIFVLIDKLYSVDLLNYLCFSTIDIRIILDSINVSQLSPDVQNTFNEIKDKMINNASVRNGILMDKTGAEFNRLLSIEPYIANKLYEFTINKLNLLKIRSSETILGLYYHYSDFKVMLSKPTDIYVLIDNFFSLMEYFTTSALTGWGLWLMDVYTLSRMFIQQSQQVIVYAGDAHSESYAEFVKYLGATTLTEHLPIYDDRCVITGASTIPNIDDFREVYQW